MKNRTTALAALIALIALAPPPEAGGPAAAGGGFGKAHWPDDFAVRARRHIEAMVAIGPRRAGSQNEARTADYIASQFLGMGIPADIEPFAFESFEPSVVEMKVGNETFTPAGLGLDPYSGEPGTSYSGAFHILDPRAPSGWPPAEAVAGKAVVTSEAGDPSLHFRIAALGPKAVIDLSPGDFDRVQVLKDQELTLSVQGGLVGGTSRNVVARLGPNPPAPQIIIGAHLDACRDFPGANDNASGVAALLELARYMKGLEIPEGIGLTFVAFGSEEVGVLGSRQYVERHVEELKNCPLVFIFDDLGGEIPVHIERNGGQQNPPHNPGVSRIPEAYRGRSWEGLRYPWKLLPPSALFAALGTPYHPAWLVDSIDEAVKELDFEVQFTPIQGSDQMSFALAGIATSGISAPNGRGHTDDDRPETVSIEKVRHCAEAAGRIIQKTWHSLPPASHKQQTVPDRVCPFENNRKRADLMAHVRFLASDELRGRQAGTPDGEIVARYIAERLRAAGVETLPNARDFFQDVVWRGKDASSASQPGSPAALGGSASVPAPLQAPNVVGFIRGRDANMAGEYVLLMAHYDHLGVRSVDGAEMIFNGARDNAMGVAALLTAAETLAPRPPARSILILATTAEEEGMIGSRFFVDHPLVPLVQIVFVLNNDGAGVYEPGLWCLGGLERTTAGPLADAAGRAHGLITRPYPEKYRFLFAKGDAASFADKGIPSLTVSPGFTEGDEERILKYFHKPADRVDADFDEDYLLKFCLAFAALARAVADAGRGDIPAEFPF